MLSSNFALLFHSSILPAKGNWGLKSKFRRVLDNLLFHLITKCWIFCSRGCVKWKLILHNSQLVGIHNQSYTQWSVELCIFSALINWSFLPIIVHLIQCVVCCVFWVIEILCHCYPVCFFWTVCVFPDESFGCCIACAYYWSSGNAHWLNGFWTRKCF